MGKICDSVLELVGGTPLVRLHRLERSEALPSALYAKLEFLNPTRSSGDRAVKAVWEQAEAAGKLRKGDSIIAAVTGNTGIALGQWATVKGCKLTVVLPGAVSREKRKLISGFGAKIITMPRQRGIEGAAEKARELAAETENAFLFDELSESQTGPVTNSTIGQEIFTALGGEMDILVVPCEIGGILGGAGRYLKEKNKAIQIVAVEEEGVPLPAANTGEFDRSAAVSEKEARAWASKLARREGILAGISAGAALAAAAGLAKEAENEGKNIVLILPDTGERYLSTGAYGEVLTPPEPF